MTDIAKTFIAQAEGKVTTETGDITDQAAPAAPDVNPESSTGEPAEPASTAQSGDTPPAESVDGNQPKNETGGELDVSRLTDEDFSKLAARMLDPKSPFHQNKAWKRILTQRDTYRGTVGNLEKMLAESNPKAYREYLVKSGRMDEANEVDTREEAPRDENRDMAETMMMYRFAKELGVDPETMSAEDRTGLKNLTKYIAGMNAPIMNELNTLKNYIAQKEGRQSEEKLYSDNVKESQELEKNIKDEFGISLDDIVDDAPVRDRMNEYLDKHPNFVGGPSELFYVSHAKYLKDMGKRARDKEIAKLNSDKKKANSEQTGGAVVKSGDSKTGSFRSFFSGM